jgi:hypothetical protein
MSNDESWPPFLALTGFSPEFFDSIRFPMAESKTENLTSSVIDEKH